MTLTELQTYFRQGGFTLLLLVVASILALGVSLERIVALWGVSHQARTLSEVLTKHILRGDLSTAKSAAERSDASCADLFRAGFARLEQSPSRAALAGAVERERVHLGLRMRKHLWILGTLGATTPFVGLFGTVAGIMRSFRDLGLDVQAGGSGGTASVMTGISEALVATAAGIAVAVEAVVLYNYFQARVSRLSVELRVMADEFIELLDERRPAASPGAPSPEA
ncbi:MAG: MotA/TolQ/ExbB proton channel family protein [Myxococcaceae bacterium]